MHSTLFGYSINVLELIFGVIITRQLNVRYKLKSNQPAGIGLVSYAIMSYITARWFGINWYTLPWGSNIPLGEAQFILLAILAYGLFLIATSFRKTEPDIVPNQSTDPTLASGTPAAGQPPRLP